MNVPIDIAGIDAIDLRLGHVYCLSLAVGDVPVDLGVGDDFGRHRRLLQSGLLVDHSAAVLCSVREDQRRRREEEKKLERREVIAIVECLACT